MDSSPAPVTPAVICDAFVGCAGRALWQDRLTGLGNRGGGPRASRALLQRHAIELALDRMRRGADGNPAERGLALLAADAVTLLDTLPEAGRIRLHAQLRAALTGNGSLVALFHLLRTARLQRARGFCVQAAGLEDDAPFDLLIRRDGAEAEIACAVMSAEDGRGVHRGAWFQLMDMIDPDLQTWLSAHPGRYLLKLTLPQGLQPGEDENAALPALHRRIRDLLTTQRRADHDEAAVLRLDPLLLAAAQASDSGLMSRLRQEFGPEAHLAVTAAGKGVFAMAARSGSENAVPLAMRHELERLAPTRLTGTRPGILAVFLDDLDGREWRVLRDRLDLEGEARQFLTRPEARRVVAVTCATRAELFGAPQPDAAPDGELRFRNPSHPAAKTPALAPSVLSTL